MYYDILNSFCFCQQNARECLSEKGSSALCKHVLAARLAEALSEQDKDVLQLKVIEDNDFAPLLLQSKHHLQKFDQKLALGARNQVSFAR